MINTVIFQSISDIPAWINEHPSVVDGTAERSSGSKSWDLGAGFSGMMDMAKDGGFWPEGADHMIDATSKMSDLKRDGFAPTIEMDVAGQYLDIEEYLDGSPECFSTIEEAPVQIVKIGVQQYTPGGNDFQDYLNRGAAIMSVIDDLEMQDIRVELWGCVSGINRNSREDGSGIDMRTCLKQADENWSPSSVAFGLCHAGFGRRLGFRVVEAFDNNRGYCGGGHTLDFKKDRPVDSDFDVWLGYSDMVSTSYPTVEVALKKVTAEIERQLKTNEGESYAQIEL